MQTHDFIRLPFIFILYVRAGVQQENQSLGKIMFEQIQALIDFLSQKLPQAVMLDSGALIDTLPPGIDAKFSYRLRRNER